MMVLTLSTFGGWDWAVLGGYLLLTTWLGTALAGKQRNLEDFFRGGSKLPWYAVSASMIATIISAVTFVAVPARAWGETGDFTYLQFGIIAGLLARLAVAGVLVPAYFRYNIYSPYDYMGRQLGEAARSITTALFSLLGMLGQAARVYLTALILELLLQEPLGALYDRTGIDPFTWSVIAVGLVAVLWTMVGGVATVVWTDAMLFVVFVLGGMIALAVIGTSLPDGFSQLVLEGWEAGKFRLWNLDLGLGGDDWRRVFTEPFTIWAAIFAVTFGSIGSYGTDQLLAQRIFCCKNAKHAKLAVLVSWVGELVAALMLLVGVGLWVFYRQFPEALNGQWAEAVERDAIYIFPVFILTQVPVGLTGLIVAGIFAAAISSLTSILAALAQTTLSAVYLPIRRVEQDRLAEATPQRELLWVSRALVVFWGAALCAMSLVVREYVNSMREAGKPVPFLDLALGLSSYVIGALLAAFLLAWLPLKKNAYGLLWSAPLSIFTVFACRFHDQNLPSSFANFFFSAPEDFWALKICGLVSVVLLVSWGIAAFLHRPRRRRSVLTAKTFWLMVGCAIMLLTTAFGWFDGTRPSSSLAGGATGAMQQVKNSIAWPWYAPVGGIVALVFGYLLGEPQGTEN